MTIQRQNNNQQMFFYEKEIGTNKLKYLLNLDKKIVIGFPILPL